MKSYLLSIEYEKDGKIYKETVLYRAKTSIGEAFDSLSDEFKKKYGDTAFLITNVYSEDII